MSGCRWNMVSMGFWSPVGWGHGQAVRPGLACLHPTWCPGPSLTKFRLLQKHLGKGPANATNERGPQHQGKALHVELRGLVGEHEEAPGDKEDHQDQSRTLLEWGAVATDLGVLRSSNLECGGQQPSRLPVFPTTWRVLGSSFPPMFAELTFSCHIPNTPTRPKTLTCFPVAALGPQVASLPPLYWQIKGAALHSGEPPGPRLT